MSYRHEKHKTLEMLLHVHVRAYILRIFKIMHFSKSSVAHAKIVEIILFWLNIVQ